MKKYIEVVILFLVVLLFGLVGAADVDDAIQRQDEVKALCGEDATKIEDNKVCKKI